MYQTDNVVATIIKFTCQGAETAAAAIGKVKNAAGIATRSMATLATSLGTAGGALGKAVGQVANFVGSIQQMGAMGGLIAGAQMLITQISDHFIEKANKMREAIEAMAERTKAKLDKMNAERMEGVKHALDEATVKAKEAAEKAYTAAINARIRKDAESDAARERATQAENARTAALNDAERDLRLTCVVIGDYALFAKSKWQSRVISKKERAGFGNRRAPCGFKPLSKLLLGGLLRRSLLSRRLLGDFFLDSGLLGRGFLSNRFGSHNVDPFLSQSCRHALLERYFRNF